MSSALLRGQELTIPFRSYQTTMYSINAPSQQLVNARALTRVNQILLSFHKSDGETLKELNNFYLSPQGQNISVQASIGERLYPDHRCDNLSQHFYRLLNGLGINSSNATLNITKSRYATDAFLSCTDVEAVPGQAHASGLSTHGAQMTFDLRDIGASSSDLPTKAFTTVWHEAILSIGQDGCTLAT